MTQLPDSASEPSRHGSALTYYQLLELPANASTRQIRQAYRQLSKRYHPDTSELDGAIAHRHFQYLQHAYATLNDPKLRAAYDEKLGYIKASEQIQRGLTLSGEPTIILSPEEVAFRKRCRADTEEFMGDLQRLFVRLILVGIVSGVALSFLTIKVVSNLQTAPPVHKMPAHPQTTPGATHPSYKTYAHPNNVSASN